MASNTTATLPTELPNSKDFSSIITFLTSFSAVSDWLKLIIIGGFLETCRRSVFSVWHKIVDVFFVTAQFEQDDSSFDWMMVWLSKQPSWTKAREVQVSTDSFGLNSPAITVPGEAEDPNGRKLAYLPVISATYSFFYKHRWMTVTRNKSNTGYYGRMEETLEISIMTRDRKFLDNLLLTAKKEYLAASESTICVYVADTSNNWRHVATRPKRPLRSIVLDPGMKDVLIDDAKDFLESKRWYTERGIPYRRGYLLYGAPGSGKTSIIHSLAGELGLHIYIISLSRIGLDDTSLSELISGLPEKCIALMEDIDAAFTHSVTREAAEEEPASPGGTPTDGSPNRDTSNTGGRQAPQPPAGMSRITLSGLLNALDGISAQEGRILFATTNKYTSLDPALCRPGRMDLHVEFKLASKYQAQELFKRFYLPTEEDAAEEKDDESEKGSVDSGYAPSDSAERPLIDLDEKSTTPTHSPPPSTPASPSVSNFTYTGDPHRVRAPSLSRNEVTALAEQFSDAIPERELSMASLQGYLMTYKIRPLQAVRDARTWVEQERFERNKHNPTTPSTPSITDDRAKASAPALLVPGAEENTAEIGSLLGSST